MDEVNEKLREEVLDFMYELRQNHFPTERQFTENNKHSIYSRIVRIYGNTRVFCVKNKFYTKSEYLKAISRGKAKMCGQDELTPECKKIIDDMQKYVNEHGYEYMPGKSEFDADGMVWLYRLIYRNFNSIIDVREALKLPTKAEWRQTYGK